ncbi:hypothetical protein OXX79_001881 [Metschnikowia pulcherrima]
MNSNPPPNCNHNNIDTALENVTEKDIVLEVEKLKLTESIAETPETSNHEESSTDASSLCAVEYRGDMVKPLASFEKFDIKPEISNLKWIKDHTSGETHDDMPTIAKLYNQNLELPAAAKSFLKQSPKLIEEANWERRKAIFYAKYPGEDAFETLSEMSVLEARRIIAKKTARHEHEVVLEALEAGIDHSEIIFSLNSEIKAMCNRISGSIPQKKDSFHRSQKSVEKYKSFGASDRFLKQDEIRSNSETWSAEILALQKNMEDYTETELFLSHLSHSKAWYEPRTASIHIKTELISDVESDLFNRASKLYSSDNFRQGTGSDKRNFNAECQLERFELGLYKFGTGPFKLFDTLYNVGPLQAFCFYVPYERVSPSMCGAVLLNHGKSTRIDWKLVSIPNTSGFPQINHCIRVYCSKVYLDYVNTRPKGSESRLECYKPYAFCFDCFSRAHQTSSSQCPKYKVTVWKLGY